MMFEYLGWFEVAQLIENGIKTAIERKTVTYDFARLMEGATEVSCSAFGTKVIEAME